MVYSVPCIVCWGGRGGGGEGEEGGHSAHRTDWQRGKEEEQLVEHGPILGPTRPDTLGKGPETLPLHSPPMGYQKQLGRAGEAQYRNASSEIYE